MKHSRRDTDGRHQRPTNETPLPFRPPPPRDVFQRGTLALGPVNTPKSSGRRTVRPPDRRSPPRRARRPEEIVRQGWNKLSSVYRPEGSRTDRTGHPNQEYKTWLTPLLVELPEGARVLDLGCGNGNPTAILLSRRFRLTGVDISEVQVRRARGLVPGARFLRADMTRVRFPAGTFAAVVMLYSMIHVPLRKQRPLLRRIFRWIAAGGLLLAIIGSTAWTGRESSWLGVEADMYWSHADASTYQRWLRELGFSLLQRRFIPEGDSGHELFLVRKPGSVGSSAGQPA
ncbi:MAG: class I SAM-dependent methyltransferase [Thermoplasmata archaeon]|nr:class I SAM-dependent methyltransferase [Thermoplasmata archaeon]